MPLNLVTGATGFLGSHIVERLLEDNQPVRVIVRPGSNSGYLDRLPVDKVVANLEDRSAVEKACKGVDAIYHAAAKVDAWGPWEGLHRQTVEVTRNLANAAHKLSVRRFLHISSVSVYGSLPADEDAIPRAGKPDAVDFPAWNRYGMAKLQAEKVLWHLHETEGFPVTVIRPTSIYGPRDRITVPSIYRMLLSGQLRILGNGENRLGVVFVKDVANACVLAARSDHAVGQAYNCTSDEPVTQRDFLTLWANAFGRPAPSGTAPYWLAFSIASLYECAARLLRNRTIPSTNRYGIWIMGKRPCPSVEKASQQLGWRSEITHREGISQSARWYMENMHGQESDVDAFRSRRPEQPGQVPGPPR